MARPRRSSFSRPDMSPWGFLARLRARREEKRRDKEARLVLRSVLKDPTRLAGTSLRPEHANRVMVVRHERDAGDGRLLSVFFTILRHPRPYAFSRQHHEVLELWRLDAATRRLERVEGANLSRLKGGDGEPAGFGPGV